MWLESTVQLAFEWMGGSSSATDNSKPLLIGQDMKNYHFISNFPFILKLTQKAYRKTLRAQWPQWQLSVCLS